MRPLLVVFAGFEGDGFGIVFCGVDDELGEDERKPGLVGHDRGLRIDADVDGDAA